MIAKTRITLLTGERVLVADDYEAVVQKARQRGIGGPLLGSYTEADGNPIAINGGAIVKIERNGDC